MTAFQDHIILGGNRFPIDCRVRTWESTGMQFKAGMGANKKRKQPIDLAVTHWTAGENPPAATFKFLRDVRGLGTEFGMDADGVLWQFADPLEVDTADCGHFFNARSLGVEVQSYGWRKKGQPQPAKRAERPETIHGHEYLVAAFHEPQKRALAALWKCLVSSKTTLIELQAPAETSRTAFPRLLPGQFVREFRGVVGHFHLSEEKTDPGLEIFDWAFEKGILSPALVESGAAVSRASKPRSAALPAQESSAPSSLPAKPAKPRDL